MFSNSSKIDIFLEIKRLYPKKISHAEGIAKEEQKQATDATQKHVKSIRVVFLAF